jgi:methionyl-tRNA formyltransferase
VPIGHDETAQEVFAKCVKAARLVIERQLEALTTGTAPRRKQDDSQATYFGGRTPEDGRIDWTQGAEKIYNLIRAVTQPYPGAFTDVEGKRMLIWWAIPLPGEGGAPGEVLSLDPLRVATGNGILDIVNWEWEDDSVRELTVGQLLGA